MTEISKNLNLARTARTNDNAAEAKAYYKAVFSDMPENLEAEWYYRFLSITEEINNETAENYARLYEIFYPTLRYVAALEDKNEKLILASDIIKGFPPLQDILYSAIFHPAYSDPSLLSNKDFLNNLAKLKYMPEVDKRELADKIIEIFGDSQPYGMLAADIWKELIAERFKQSEYRNYKDKGKKLWFDELGEKIKKYDPTYQMPQFKQAGCIVFGEAAKSIPAKEGL